MARAMLSHWRPGHLLRLADAGLADEKRRPGSRIGLARFRADRALDKVHERFSWEAAGYASVALGLSRAVPDEFRELAEKELWSVGRPFSPRSCESARKN